MTYNSSMNKWNVIQQMNSHKGSESHAAVRVAYRPSVETSRDFI